MERYNWPAITEDRAHLLILSGPEIHARSRSQAENAGSISRGQVNRSYATHWRVEVVGYWLIAIGSKVPPSTFSIHTECSKTVIPSPLK